jgi:hypothetical protein
MELEDVHELMGTIIIPGSRATIAWQPETNIRVRGLIIDKPEGLELFSMRVGAVEQLPRLAAPVSAEIFGPTSPPFLLILDPIPIALTFSVGLRNVTDKPIMFTGRVYFIPA